MPNEREARLKREFARLYPGLKPGVWYKAAWSSARQFARIPCDGRAESMESVVNEQHFEFRGGSPGAAPSLPSDSSRVSGNHATVRSVFSCSTSLTTCGRYHSSGVAAQ